MKRRVLIALVFVLLFVAGGLWGSHQIIGNVKSYTNAVDHTREVIAGFETLQNYFKSSQMYSRKLDSTYGIPLFQHYKEEAYKIEAQTAWLLALTADNPRQTKLIGSLQQLLRQQFPALIEKNLSEMIQAGESDRLAVFASINQLIKQGIAIEEALLVKRQAQLNKSTKSLSYGLTIAAIFIVFCVVLFSLYIIYKRNLLQGFLGSVLDTSTNAIIHYKAVRVQGQVVDFEIVYINKETEKCFGIRPEQAVGSTLNQRIKASDTDLFPYYLQAVQTGKPNSFEVVFNEGGAERWFLASVAAQNDGITACFQEITTQKQYALELARKNAQLNHTNAELERFIHVASHDLKEPVRKARFFTSLLQGDLQLGVFNNTVKYAERISVATDRMMDMVTAVEQYALLTEPEKQAGPVDVNNIVKAVEADLGLLMRHKAAALQYRPLPVVWGYGHLLHQLFYNLLHNALKFSKQGVAPIIQIEASVCTQGEQRLLNLPKQGPYICISIRDNGLGFSAEKTSVLFDAFRHLHSKDKFEGAGLGLAICKKIVALHQGRIRAEGETGEGAVFFVYLPLVDDLKANANQSAVLLNGSLHIP